jgi:protease II
VITIFEGSHTIWFCAPHKQPKRLFSIKAGDITPFYWSDWESVATKSYSTSSSTSETTLESYTVKSPFSIPQIIHIVENTVINNKSYYIKNTLFIERPIQFKPLEVHRFHTISKDGTKVPYVLIKEKGDIKALLIYVYGAYGSSSAIEWPYKTWYSLLQRKWAIVYALVRGGGDVTMNWANQGRLDNRHHSIDDFEAVIKAAQLKTGITAKHTVIYGRSAGGVPVGAMVSRYPDGQLMGAAYTEVPYVDMLRDTTNPELPLTVGEYKEFGNPRENILDFAELLHVSPIDTLPADGAPGVFVLSRVGLLDLQVYSYESFKWIQLLRGNTEVVGLDPKGKYVIYDKGEAHQYSKEHSIPTHATDMALLDAWVEGRVRL